MRQQKFENFEVIVVDDGSTDDTKEMLRSYGDRTRYVFQENRRPSAARNLGVGLAKSRWIAIQDSDDASRSGLFIATTEWQKGGEKGNKESAREALRHAVVLCPFAVKYRLYI